MYLGRHNTLTTHVLVLEFTWFISCETALCFLSDLSVTNNDDFHHACYTLPHYTLP